MKRIYSTHDENYLHSTTDNVGRTVHGFRINDDIHLVYDINKENQFYVIKSIEEITSNPDAFLFTPYIEFVNIFE